MLIPNSYCVLLKLGSNFDSSQSHHVYYQIIDYPKLTLYVIIERDKVMIGANVLQYPYLE